MASVLPREQRDSIKDFVNSQNYRPGTSGSCCVAVLAKDFMPCLVRAVHVVPTLQARRQVDLIESTGRLIGVGSLIDISIIGWL